jgi:hypothetical protein
MAQDAYYCTLRHSTIIYYLLTINYDAKGLSLGIIFTFFKKILLFFGDIGLFLYFCSQKCRLI